MRNAQKILLREYCRNFFRLNTNLAVWFHSWGAFRRPVQCVPLATEPGISLIILPLMRILQRNLKQLGALQTHTTDTFLFISHTTNVLLFKFRCNIFIGVRIIKEIPGSVASGTLCTCILRPCVTFGYFPRRRIVYKHWPLSPPTARKCETIQSTFTDVVGTHLFVASLQFV